MRPLTLPLIAVLLALLPVAAAAQPRGRDPRQPPLSHADSLRRLGGPAQLWVHFGVGWLGAPSDVRQRYQAGIGVGASGDRRFADRVALRGRLDFTDLPSTQPGAVNVGGFTYAVNDDYGHGWAGSAMAGAAVRAWSHLWLEGAAGAAYFRNGFPSGDTFQDLGSGRDIPFEAPSGWGAIWDAGIRYEFQPTRRDRMLGEFQFGSMDRDGTQLRFLAIRVGYRGF